MKNLGKGIAVAVTALAALGAIIVIIKPVAILALIAPMVVAMFAFNDND